MQQAVSARTPVHLWIVGIFALLFSGFGCTDYTMTRLHNANWVTSQMPGVDPNAAFAWVAAMPLYAQIGWGLGVWTGLLGAVLLLLRSRHAVLALGVSLLGAVLSLGWQIALAPPLAGATGFMFTGMPYIIIAVCVALFLYARAQAAKGVLR